MKRLGFTVEHCLPFAVKAKDHATKFARILKSQLLKVEDKLDEISKEFDLFYPVDPHALCCEECPKIREECPTISSTPKPFRVAVISLDFDGCGDILTDVVEDYVCGVQGGKLTPNFADARARLVAKLEKITGDMDEVILYIGSNRQSVAADLHNRMHRQRENHLGAHVKPERNLCSLAQWYWKGFEVGEGYNFKKEARNTGRFVSLLGGWGADVDVDLDDPKLDGFCRFEYERIVRNPQLVFGEEYQAKWTLWTKPLLPDKQLNNPPGTAWNDESMHFSGADPTVKGEIIDYQVQQTALYVKSKLKEGQQVETPIPFYFFDDKPVNLDYVLHHTDKALQKTAQVDLHTVHYDWFGIMTGRHK